MPQLMEGSVETYTNNVIIVRFAIECEDELMREIEKTRLEGWLTQLAKENSAPYGTIRRNKSGEVIYGDLEK